MSYEPAYSPWGLIQTRKTLCPGFFEYSSGGDGSGKSACSGSDNDDFRGHKLLLAIFDIYDNDVEVKNYFNNKFTTGRKK